jgi:protein gp37
MGANSEISWTDATFNPWWGCVKVSPACTNCYAAAWAKRHGTDWGPKARRRFFGEKHWNEPLKWNTKAAAEGVRRRVFCASMADVFELLPDGHPDQDQMTAERYRLWKLIGETPSLDWLLLTKRPENVIGMVPGSWLNEGFPRNVWMGTTAENQEYADLRVLHLLTIPAPVLFLSMEPLLSAVDLTPWMPLRRIHCGNRVGEEGGQFHGAEWKGDEHLHTGAGPHWFPAVPFSGIHWVIAGGESGPGARPSDPAWFRSLRDQCQAAGVPFHFKQFGDWLPLASADEASHFPQAPMTDDHRFVRIGKKQAGRVLDGVTHDAFPEARS